ncbi:MAG: histidine kinase [Acidobacteriota bacterium]|nr:histidine kinase [Acidobacteriota bacterium]
MGKSIIKWLAKILVIDAAIAIAAPLFRSFFDAQATFSELARQYLFSVIYANLIGIPLCLILPFVWARTCQFSIAGRSAIRGGIIVLGNLVGCLIAGVILQAIFSPQYSYWNEFRHSFGLSLVLSAIAVAFLSTYETQQAKLRTTAMQLKTKELERERALKLATEARLASLESRIHPHFLFNTINSVSALIHEDPLRAERILTQLAELLRFSLDVPSGGLVPLEGELQIVEDYLEIEKARFGPRLRYEIEVPESLHAVPVPPLSLQTLVENSVKYAVGPRGRGASVAIRALECAGWLRLEVSDDGPGFSFFELPSGHGLANLQERIIALFGETAKLDISSDELRTIVAIEIPRSAPMRVALPERAAVRQTTVSMER